MTVRIVSCNGVLGLSACLGLGMDEVVEALSHHRGAPQN